MRTRSSNFLAIFTLFLLCISSVSLAGQHDTSPKQRKPTPPSLFPQISVLWDKVVLDQWPATLDLINYPGQLEQIEPRQCIRVGIGAKGDDASKLLNSSRFSYAFEFQGERKSFPDEAAAAIKQLKPEGGDFVTEVVGAANLKIPLPTTASIAALQNGWCAPADVQNGALSIDVKVVSGGKETKLEHKSIPVTTFASARQTVPFSTTDSFGTWAQHYHLQPTPAFLLPAMRLVAADNRYRGMLNVMQFMVTALKSSPAAADELRKLLPSESQATKIYGTYVLGQAGYPIDDLLQAFDEKTKVPLKNRLPDPYDLSPDQLLPQKQDMLWAIFFASGRREPVEVLASMLAWKKDYEAFEEVRKAHEKDPSIKIELSPALIRGVTYISAGWSLSAISTTDPLVTDYLSALRQTPTFPEAAKLELDTLHTNPVFKQGPGGR